MLMIRSGEESATEMEINRLGSSLAIQIGQRLPGY